MPLKRNVIQEAGNSSRIATSLKEKNGDPCYPFYMKNLPQTITKLKGFKIDKLQKKTRKMKKRQFFEIS